MLHSFAGSPDGDRPGRGRLVDVNGTFYGTTYYGGTQYYGGTVYSITPSGAETVVYSFGPNAYNGNNPGAGLIYVASKGLFYGTTASAGAYSYGTVFSMTPSGTVTPLWAFGGSPGGSDSQSDVTWLDGTLYGTTAQGGTDGYGTIFKLYSL